MTEFLQQLLNQQTHLINGVKPWVLGACEDTSTIKKSINYDNLLELFESIVEDGSDYFFSYDQTVWPWRVSLVRKSSEVASEFRLSRNIEKCTIKDNDSELCTRLILNVNALTTNASIGKQQNTSVMRTYDNAAAQAIYGIITKTADIDTEDSLPGGPFPEADKWAADFMARRAQPQVQIQIDGSILAGITGDTWDESRIGTMCRVALPDYAESIAERVVSINYPDLYGTPDRVSVSLANALPKFSASVKTISRSIAKSARGGRGSARAEKDFRLHFEYADEAGNILKQAGMVLDPDGLLVYADDNVNMVGARFNVQADKIGMVVGTNEHGNYVKAGEIALAINSTSGESTAMINATHVNISGTNTVHTLAGDLEHDENGNLIIKNAGGLYVRRTQDGVTSQFGVWDNGNLTGGVMVRQINGQSNLKLKADVIDIDGVVNSLTSKNITVGGIAAGSGDFRGCNIDALQIQGYDFGICSFKVDGVVKGSFIGDGDINFSTPSVVVTLDDSGWVINDASTGDYTRTFTPKKNGVAVTSQVATISAQTIWNLGWNACRKWVLDHSHSVVEGAHSWNSNDNATALYVAPQSGAAKATGQNQVWRYGGTKTTYYSAPSAK